MAPPELDSPSHSSLSGLKLMAKSWETWREGGGSWCTPYHSPPPVPQPRVPRGMSVSLGSHRALDTRDLLTSYLGGILAPKPSAENFLSLQGKGCEEL